MGDLLCVKFGLESLCGLFLLGNQEVGCLAWMEMSGAGAIPSFQPGAGCERASRHVRPATAQLVPESLSDRVRGLAGRAGQHVSAKASEAVLRCFGACWAPLARRQAIFGICFAKKHRSPRHNYAFWLPPPPGGRGLLGTGQDPDSVPRDPDQVTTPTPSQGVPIKSLPRLRPKGIPIKSPPRRLLTEPIGPCVAIKPGPGAP